MMGDDMLWLYSSMMQFKTSQQENEVMAEFPFHTNYKTTQAEM